MNTQISALALLALLWALPGMAQADPDPNGIGDLGSGSCSAIDVITEPQFQFFIANITCDVFSDDPNSGNPVIVPGHNTYVYTVENSNLSSLDLIQFRVAHAGAATIDAAGFLVGTGDVSPSNTAIQPSEVEWTFDAPVIQPSQTGDQLYVVSPFAPASGAVGVVSAGGFSGTGNCLVPAIPPAEVELSSIGDSFMRNGARDSNEGANIFMRVRKSGRNSALVNFDISGVPNAPLTSAALVLTIHPSKGTRNWGKNMDRTVDVHLVSRQWVEGNGRLTNASGPDNTRGSGSGVTHHCPIDTDILDHGADCPEKWNGGFFEPTTTPGVVHVNDMVGEVVWDVTQDLQRVLDGEVPWYGFTVRKTPGQNSGHVRYYSREGAAEAGDASLGPRLLLEFDD